MRSPKISFVLAGLALLVFGGLPTAAQTRLEFTEARTEYIRSHYTKYEYRIPVRDGVRLFTAVYVPNDAGPDRRYPMLMVRTPYSVAPYGADQYPEWLGPSERFEQEGFIFVFQDVRGRMMSEGEFVNMRPHRAQKKGSQDVDESTDTYDSIEWLLHKIPHHSGRVGQWGISYPGFYTSAGAIDSHPALKAVSPQAPIADWFWDDMHHHGAFILPLAFNFFSSFGQARPEPTTERAERMDHGTPDGYAFFHRLGPLKNANTRYFHGEIDFWNQIVAHPNYDDFWQSRNLLPHLKNISAAVLVVGGWYDTEDLFGPLNTYAAIERQNPGAENSIVMGPWIHGGWRRTAGDALGPVEFGYATGPQFQDEVLYPFFHHHLKGDGADDPPVAEARMFETGADRWRSFDQWPPKAATTAHLYLRGDGAVAWDPPPTGEEAPDAHDTYVSDPARPVPYTQEITNAWAKRYMTEDQRFAAWRPDVLVYETDALQDDVTLAGPLDAELWVSTTGGDADWIVKVIDVYPDRLPGWEDKAERERREEAGETDLGGYQQLVRAEVMRGRFRESYTVPKPFTPGEITAVNFRLHDVLHTFQRGHRIMVQIQSTWFPFVDRNPQKWVANIFEANAEDFTPATHRVYRSPEHPSRIQVGILPH